MVVHVRLSLSKNKGYRSISLSTFADELCQLYAARFALLYIGLSTGPIFVLVGVLSIVLSIVNSFAVFSRFQGITPVFTYNSKWAWGIATMLPDFRWGVLDREPQIKNLRLRKSDLESGNRCLLELPSRQLLSL